MPKADQILINDFHSLGFSLNIGNGNTPLTWLEIKAFSDLRFEKLSMFESESLIMMSREYCSWLIKASDLNCQSPWHSETYNAIESNATQVNAGFKALMARAKKKNKPA